ncbi:hypothetical protein JDV09_16650 [Mycobacterium sp. Y57]|nr:hypothetical protein [Mycolicibacterium xanthum]
MRRHARSDPDAARTLAGLAAVRRELARLGSDADSAPEVPAAVTARVAEALRTAPPVGGHRVARPALTRPQRAGLILGILALAAASIVGVWTLTRSDGPRYPAGPTASTITVPDTAAPEFPVSVDDLRRTLTVAPALGALEDPQRLASCLVGLGYPATTAVLGGDQRRLSGRDAVLLLLPGDTPDRFVAVLVEPGCSAAHTGVLARTESALP